MAAEYTGVNGEVINTLLALLDESVAVDFPCELAYIAVYLFESLIDGHSTHRHRTVADDPFAGFVNVVAGGEVHKSVTSPVAAPHRLVHFLFDRRG